MRHKKTIILSLVLASVLFMAGSGQAVALDRADDDGFAGGHLMNLLERVGSYISNLVVEVVEILEKEGPEVTADG